MKNRLFARLALFSVAASTVASSAMAALPAGVSTGLDGVKADGLALVDLIWPVVIAFVGAGVVLKLFKRFTGKV